LALIPVHVKAADPVLAANGTLRAAYIVANVAQARVDPATGTILGVIADISRELGRRADVGVNIIPLPTAAAVLDAVRTGQAEIGFVAPNPERTGVVLYSQTYMLVQQSALVRADSLLRSVKELDRPGQVIGINSDDSVGVWLRQRLTAAKVRETADYSLRDAVQWLQNGDVVAFAGGGSGFTAAHATFRVCECLTIISTVCRKGGRSAQSPRPASVDRCDPGRNALKRISSGIDRAERN